MAEPSPSQLINDWVTAAKSATPNNAPSVAKTIANLYTSNAALVATPEGVVNTQNAIEKDYAQNFGAGWVLTGITPNQPSINQINQNWAWAVGQWSGTLSGNKL